MRTSSPMLSVFNEHIVRCEQAGIAKKNCCSTRDSVSVKISHNYQLLAGLGSFITLVCRCWSVCHVSRW